MDVTQDAKTPEEVARRAAVARFIKHLRDRRRWSQERLAAECGLDHSLISRIESGRRSCTRETVAAVAQGCQLDDLDHDALLVAAGFLPRDPLVLFIEQPLVRRLATLLQAGPLTPPYQRRIEQVFGEVLTLVEEASQVLARGDAPLPH